MTVLTNIIVNHLFSMTNRTYSDEDIDVYKYGIECLLNNIFSDVIIIIWSLLTGTVIENLCWLVVFCTYRNHAGGAHASTNERCILSTSILGISNFVAIKYQDIWVRYLGCIVLFIILTCICLAPIKSTKKVLSKNERWLQKLISITIICGCLIISKIMGGKIAVAIIYSLLTASVLMIIALFKS